MTLIALAGPRGLKPGTCLACSVAPCGRRPSAIRRLRRGQAPTLVSNTPTRVRNILNTYEARGSF